MDRGRLVSTNAIRSILSWKRRGKKVVAREWGEFRADPGHALVFVFLGQAEIDTEEKLVKIDFEQALNDMGWFRKAETGGVTTEATPEGRGAES